MKKKLLPIFILSGIFALSSCNLGPSSPNNSEHTENNDNQENENNNDDTSNGNNNDNGGEDNKEPTIQKLSISEVIEKGQELQATLMSKEYYLVEGYVASFPDNEFASIRLASDNKQIDVVFDKEKLNGDLSNFVEYGDKILFKARIYKHDSSEDGILLLKSELVKREPANFKDETCNFGGLKLTIKEANAFKDKLLVNENTKVDYLIQGKVTNIDESKKIFTIKDEDGNHIDIQFGYQIKSIYYKDEVLVHGQLKKVNLDQTTPKMILINTIISNIKVAFENSKEPNDIYMSVSNNELNFYKTVSEKFNKLRASRGEKEIHFEFTTLENPHFQVRDWICGPDIFTYDSANLNNFIFSNVLKPLDDETVSYLTSNLNERTLEEVKKDTSYYSFPLSTESGYITYYDKNVFTDVESVKTIEGINNVLNKNSKMLGYMLKEPYYLYPFLTSFLIENTTNPNEPRYEFNSRRGLNAVKELDKLIKSNKYNPNPDSFDGISVNGTFAKDNYHNFGCANLFSIDGIQLQSMVSSRNIGLNSLKDTSKKKDNCISFMKYLMTEEIQTAKYNEFNEIPSNLDSLNSLINQNDEFVKAVVNQNKIATNISTKDAPPTIYDACRALYQEVESDNNLTDQEIFALLRDFDSKINTY